MREILFRGKTKDKEKWVYGAYIKDESPDSDGDILIVDQSKYYVFKQNWLETECVDIVIPETVGQYTGLMDKNGEKIFEGDILRQYEDTLESGKDLYFFYNVFFDESCAKFGGYEIYSNELCYFDDLEDSEIVGNIYDNPELLN